MSGLLRANLIVASGTATSRVTGMLRTAALTMVLGRTLLSDAYILANETPNIVYDLLLGGVLSATLVPLFVSYLGPNRDDSSPGVYRETTTASNAQHGTNVIITTALVLLFVLTVIAVVAAPVIFRVYTMALSSEIDAQVYRSAGAALAQIFLLQILFYGLTGVANAYLNSRRRFAAASWSPVAANLITIAALFSLPGAGTRRWDVSEVLVDARLRWTLGLGATLGIAVMACIVVAAARRSGLRYRPVLDFGHPAVRKLLRLSTWTFGFVAANQVAVVVIRNLLGSLGQGDVSAYFYAFIFFVLPHGLLAVSISTTFQPELARAVSERDPQRFGQHFETGVRSILALTLPASAIMVVMPRSVMGLLQGGNFNAGDVAVSARALAGLAVGLAAFSTYQFTLRGFYAHQNAKTPFFLNAGENVLNIVVGVALVGSLGLFGLALSYGVAYIVFAIAALVVLRRSLAPALDLAALGTSLARLLVATGVMGASLYALSAFAPEGSRVASFVALSAAAVVGGATYVLVLLLLKAPEIQFLQRFVRPR